MYSWLVVDVSLNIECPKKQMNDTDPSLHVKSSLTLVNNKQQHRKLAYLHYYQVIFSYNEETS